MCHSTIMVEVKLLTVAERGRRVAALRALMEHAARYSLYTASARSERSEPARTRHVRGSMRGDIVQVSITYSEPLSEDSTGSDRES